MRQVSYPAGSAYRKNRFDAYLGGKLQQRVSYLWHIQKVIYPVCQAARIRIPS